MAERHTSNQEKKSGFGLDWFRVALRGLRDRNSQEAVEHENISDTIAETVTEPNFEQEQSEIKEQIPYEELIKLVEEFSTKGKFSKALESVHKINEFSVMVQQEDPVQFIDNELFSQCHIYSYDLIKFLKTKGFHSEAISEPPYNAHTIVKVQTDRGQIYVDPTIGQFIQYPHVFVGTKAELRAVFMNEEYRSLYGTAVIGHTGLDTRKKWFDVLYGYLE